MMAVAMETRATPEVAGVTIRPVRADLLTPGQGQKKKEDRLYDNKRIHVLISKVRNLKRLFELSEPTNEFHDIFVIVRQHERAAFNPLLSLAYHI